MIKKFFPVFILLMFVFVQAGQAQNSIHEFFNETSIKVKATEDVTEKREILTASFVAMSNALDRIAASTLISDEDKSGIVDLQGMVRDNQDELAGLNGFPPVPDSQLNSYADYVVQTMEQAERTFTVSLVAALLIIIIVILIA